MKCSNNVSCLIGVFCIVVFANVLAQTKQNQKGTTMSNPMKVPTLNSTGGLEIVPSSASSEKDFDFFMGKWKIHNRKLKTRLNHCTEWIEFEAAQEAYKILNGLGNIDHFRTAFEGAPFEGMTLRLFNPKTKLWSIYWADSNAGVLDVPVVGSFAGKIGEFYSKDVFQGKNILVVFRWDATEVDNPVWNQAFSEDHGKTWEWNWYMRMSRDK